MKASCQVLFIQGGGEGTHDEWDHLLVASLQQHLGADFEVRYPRMPGEGAPSLKRWRPTIERELKGLRAGGIVVGHSIGATVLLKVLTELRPVPELGAIVSLAAPFVGEGGWATDELEFPTNLGDALPRGVPVHFFHGLDDDTVPPSHVESYARVVPRALIHRRAGRDHQLSNDLSDVAATIRSLRGR